MARPNGARARVAVAGAGEEKEEKSMTAAVAITVAPTSCHSFSTAFSLAIMALASSSSNGGATAPKGLVIRRVQSLNGGLQWPRILSSSSRLLLLVRKVVSTMGHKPRLLRMRKVVSRATVSSSSS